jgi:Tfp pilus assembly protein PilV
MRLRLRRCSPRNESGSLLVELLIAMTFLAVAVGALVSVFASSLLSLRHASIEGNALTLADKRMETFKTLPYSGLKLDATTIPSSADLYSTSPPSNLVGWQKAQISTGQQTGGTQAATQTVTGPDGRSYRVDSYIFATSASQNPNGEQVLQVTVAVRLVTGSTVAAIRAQTASAFDQASTIAAT